MTKQQALWAQQHDWYHYDFIAYNAPGNDYTVVVRGDEPAGTRMDNLQLFTDFQQLRAWAGY